jgi:uncharacterized protein
MAAFFFDTSGIVKRYIVEAGSGWVQNATDPAAGNVIYLARISAVEITSAVIRRQKGGSLSATVAASVLGQFRHDMSVDYRILEITPAVLSSAVLLAESHSLRAYDAVQLATVVELHTQRLVHGLSPVTLVSADQALNTAAAAAGLLVENPNYYP